MSLGNNILRENLEWEIMNSNLLGPQPLGVSNEEGRWRNISVGDEEIFFEVKDMLEKGAKYIDKKYEGGNSFLICDIYADRIQIKTEIDLNKDNYSVKYKGERPEKIVALINDKMKNRISYQGIDSTICEELNNLSKILNN